MLRVRALPILAVLAALTAGAAPAAAAPVRPAPSCWQGGVPLAPTGGTWFGASIDWSKDTVAAYARRLGRTPAVNVYFTALPMSRPQSRNLALAVGQIRPTGGALLLTLEPHGGLATVTAAVARTLARQVARITRQGVPVMVRFGHEMNGSWYPWGQQPTAYVAAFRRVAAAVHRSAPGAAMLWAPNYGGGYPFTGGRHAAVAGGPDAARLDSDRDGAVTGRDDPYAPYYPGDDAVDWVGMTLYHFGNVYPWGENELPEPGKFAALLTGTFAGLAGDETAVPDFYGVYGTGHRKPVAIPETAALHAPGRGGAAALAIKRAWWQQVFDPSTPARFPRLRMVNWFEWDKQESEIGGRVDWTATVAPDQRAGFRRALPSWLRYAPSVARCGSAGRR